MRYEEKISAVAAMPHFVALWDFVKTDRQGRYIAHTRPGDSNEYALEPRSIANDHYGGGFSISYGDFPRLNRGPFGQALRFESRETDTKLAQLAVPRARLHDSALDIKGARSVSLAAWIRYEGSNHFVAGIWHEGSDIRKSGSEALSRGMRQWALFCGLAANSGAASVHISDTGGGSFGNIYARHLAVTKQKMPKSPKPGGSGDPRIDNGWTMAGFVFDHDAHTAVAYIDGRRGEEHWIGEEQLKQGPFYRFHYDAWKQVVGAAGQPLSGDRAVSAGQVYLPPRDGRNPANDVIVSYRSEAGDESRLAVKEVAYAFHKERIVVREIPREGRFVEAEILERDLIGLCVNPYYFPGEIYAPASADQGGDFTIGKVVTHNDGNGMTGYIGAVAVFDGALSDEQMAQLARPAMLRPLDLAECAARPARQAEQPAGANGSSSAPRSSNPPAQRGFH